MKRILHVLLFLTLLVLVFSGAGRTRAPLSKEEYIKAMGKGLNKIFKSAKKNHNYKLIFSTNLFFAHGSAIKNMPVPVLKAAVDAFKEAGFDRVDINLSINPWKNGNTEVIAKYNETIRYIREQGLGLAINPEYSVTDGLVDGFESWSQAALKAYAEIASQYRPDIFVVVHEPTTMSVRMKQDVSPKQWAEFTDLAAYAVKKASPETRVGAGFLWTEMDYFKEIIKISGIDVVSVDIYSLKGLKGTSRMIALAKKRGLNVYVEETWRPPYYVPEPGKTDTLETYISTGIGDKAFAGLDQQWFAAMTRYAQAWELEAVTLFWMQPYFYYAKEGEPNSALDQHYNIRVLEAIENGERTQTYTSIKDIIKTNGSNNVETYF